MKKLIVIALVALLAIAVTMNFGAVSSGPASVPSGSASAYSYETAISSSIASSETSGVTDVSDASSELNYVSSKTNTSDGNSSDTFAPDMTREKVAALNTSQTLEYADQFYAETGYTAEQKAEADTALAQIYQSLYLDENGDTEETKFVKQRVEEYMNRQSPGLFINDCSVMLMNYVSLTDFKDTGEIDFVPSYGHFDVNVYTVMMGDETGRAVCMMESTASDKGRLQSAGYVGECTDLKAHAVKAYKLLKTTDLDLSKTTATYFMMNDFDELYYLTDGTSRYFLTFGSMNKASGELYFSWENSTGIDIENRMYIYSYDEMLNLIKTFDTSSMEDHPLGYGITMGDGTTDETASVTTTSVGETTETETTAQITAIPIWIWFVAVVAVVALVLVIVFTSRKKKKSN